MKVYILFKEHPYEDRSEFVGVFSSRDLAIAAMERLEKPLRGKHVAEQANFPTTMTTYRTSPTDVRVFDDSEEFISPYCFIEATVDEPASAGA